MVMKITKCIRGGATAFADSVDEAWYVSKSFVQNDNPKNLSLDLELQKMQTKHKGTESDNR